MLIGERRAFFRKGLSGLYMPLYDALCAELPSTFQPYQGLRTPEQQAEDYAKGRTTPPLGRGYWVTNAQPWESPHQYGVATDWAYWDVLANKPIWITANDSNWVTYRNACDKIGLRNGAAFHDVDHNELKLDVGWLEVKKVLDASGLDAALSFIKQHQS